MSQKLYAVVYLDIYNTLSPYTTYTGGGIVGIFDSRDKAEKAVKSLCTYAKEVAIIETKLNKEDEIEGDFN